MSAGAFHWSRRPFGLYRDIGGGKIAGVCAGLGAYLQIRPKFIRIAAIVGCVFGFFIPIIAAYILLAMILRPMPDPMVSSGADDSVWRRMAGSPDQAASDLKTRFRTLDQRLAELEAKVTSEDFKLRQKFRDL